jgi:hypothetical protein
MGRSAGRDRQAGRAMNERMTSTHIVVWHDGRWHDGIMGTQRRRDVAHAGARHRDTETQRHRDTETQRHRDRRHREEGPTIGEVSARLLHMRTAVCCTLQWREGIERTYTRFSDCCSQIDGTHTAIVRRILACSITLYSLKWPEIIGAAHRRLFYV